jgi:pyruvate dehydrogenase E1 component alpha subunit
MESIIVGNNGLSEAAQMSAAGRNLPNCVPVGSHILHAVGIAYAIKYRGEKDVAMAVFGDGATSEGDFHEGLNFAGVFRLPVVFVCQNNQWAISIPRKNQTRSATLAQKALAYGMAGIQVDGNDVLAVYAAAAEARQRAVNGEGPTLIECVTYRMGVHTTADDPKKYRSEEEVEVWKKKEPLVRFQRYLITRGLLSEEKIEEIESAIKARIQTAVDQAEAQMKAMGDPLAMFDHAYAKMPPYLQEQKNELAAELANGTEG